MKHLTKGQIFGIVIFLVSLVLAVSVFFMNTRFALGTIAILIWFGLCYVTILVHPLFKKHS